jgi:hypothetical protein
VRGSDRPRRTATRSRRTALVPVLLVIATIAVSCSGGGSGGDVTLPDLATLRCPADAHAASQSSSSDALPALTRLESNGLSGPITHLSHGRSGAAPAIRARGATGSTLVTQVRAAANAACALRTPADAQRAGYVRSSVDAPGVGSHWTNWRYVNARFDPAHPSMLLYARHGAADRLVGFSYWLRSRRAPAGFAGNADRWHRHFGLCFDPSGRLRREGLIDQSDCPGDWLNGGDLWMLHAWVVPGTPNPWGLFAPLNQTLCRGDTSACGARF